MSKKPQPARNGVTLKRQIACVDRQLRIMRSIYPDLVKCHRMTPQHSNRELSAMQAARDTLAELAHNEGAVIDANPMLPLWGEP